MSALVPVMGQVRDSVPRPRLLEDVWREDWITDTTAAKELRLDVNGLLFVADNEFSTPLMTGYTLPGFRLRPSVSYKPTQSIKLEAGLYMLRFWGADHYPNMAYRDIGIWSGTGKSTPGFHFVPFFRARMATKFGLNIVLGSLYGGSAHRLSEPMYAPELNLTADPETGLQLLYESSRVNLDAWINWQSFIYRNDTHQEAFIVGLSGMVKYTRPSSRLQVYSPVSLLLQHRGGELDTIYTNSVQSLMNASAGVAVKLRGDRKWWGGVTLGADFLLYRQLTGNIWPWDDGKAFYVYARGDFNRLRAKTAFFRSFKYIPLMGFPIYGSVASSRSGTVFRNTSTFTAGLEYNYTFHPGYSLGATLDWYYNPALTGVIPSTGEVKHINSTTSLSVGVYMRVTPSFLLKKF